MNPLQMRLASLRRRLRLVLTFRGLSWLVTLLLGTAALAGCLDWLVHLPALVRAILLTSTLAAAGCIILRFLVGPLVVPADDLTLALRVEAAFPFLNDSLASTVQFLERPESPGSPCLRQEVVEQALRKAEDLNFRQVVTTRGVQSAVLSLAGTAAVAVALLFFFPTLAWTGLARLTNPFGDLGWPPQTVLAIQARSRIARGEPFEIHGALQGVIPAQATVEFDGLTPAKQMATVHTDAPGSGILLVRRERVERSFRFQVRANDAVSDWQEVAVLPPPVLVPLDGRPSPQVHLTYPHYTDLLAQDLPYGSGNVEAVVGTEVALRAATDRPVARSWIEYRPEQEAVRPAAFLGPLGGLDPLGCLTLTAGSHEVWGLVPITLDPSGRLLAATFVPRVRGTYALRFEDESGVGTTRLFEMRLFPDPPPTVTLERPSRARDSLELLPQAEVTLQALAADPVFGLRSVFLEFRCGKEETPRRMPLYDHDEAEAGVIPQILGGFAAAPPLGLAPLFGLPEAAADTTGRSKLQRWQAVRRLALSEMRHVDGALLKEGDVLILQVCADDYDDVAVDKKPGRSHEVELHIVGRNTLERNLLKAQGDVQKELLALRKLQREALQPVITADQQWRNTGKLRDKDLDQLLQAEQLQQQVHSRVGTKEEGLRAEVARILQTLKDNHVAPTGGEERMETVANELERLARKELEQIEPRITSARKQREADKLRQPAAGKGPLAEARQHQEEVENTFTELLQLLEPWSSINEVKGEARSILHEQQKINEEMPRLDAEQTRGSDRRELSPEQRAALDRMAEWQQKLGERTGTLLGKMERLGQARQTKERPTAEALQQAAAQGRKEEVGRRMQDAGQKIHDNKLGEAGQLQQQTLKALEQVVEALDVRRERELDRLAKKLKETEEKIAELAQRQKELQKKAREAGQIPDAKDRQNALKRLARQQEQIQKETQEALRELTRLRSRQAARDLADAGEQMEQAARQLERGEEPSEAQEESLDRLNDARRAVKQEQRAIEEELARERLVKVADEIKRLKERQQGVTTEADRLLQLLSKKRPERRLVASLGQLAHNQEDLGQDTDTLAKDKLAKAPVFARIVGKSAQAMTEAAERLREYQQRLLDADQVPAEQESPRLQRQAVRRLDQLLDILKPEGQARRSPEPGDAGSGRAPRGDEGISGIAQLKGLRMLQQDINERTDSFGKRHPKADKLSEADQCELQSIRQDQNDVTRLLDELTNPGPAEGEGK
jgi:hypothetical protein